MTISGQISVLIGIATTLAVIAASSTPAYAMEREMRSQTDMAATDYLTNFGYLSSPTSGNANSPVHGSSLTEAIKEFQGFFGLTVTGKEDDETLRAMAKPRCGFRDKNGSSSGSDNRVQSYTLRNRWNKKALTYRISIYTKKLPQDKVDREIARAFAVWSEYTDFTFTTKSWGPVDIEIQFVEGWHGNCPAFEGLNGVLAHAAFPYSGGYAHFDDAEPWTIESPHGTNLFQIAAHEFGHSLGLDHSDVQSALMSPWPPMQYDPYFKLDSDDVEGIQTLYGRKRNRNRSGGSPQQPRMRPDDPTPGGYYPPSPQQPRMRPDDPTPGGNYPPSPQQPRMRPDYPTPGGFYPPFPQQPRMRPDDPTPGGNYPPSPQQPRMRPDYPTPGGFYPPFPQQPRMKPDDPTLGGYSPPFPQQPRMRPDDPTPDGYYPPSPQQPRMRPDYPTPGGYYPRFPTQPLPYYPIGRNPQNPWNNDEDSWEVIEEDRYDEYENEGPIFTSFFF